DPTPPARSSSTDSMLAPTSATDLSRIYLHDALPIFRIERCQGAGCATFAEIATVGANVVSYSNTGLTAATTYQYRVRAYNTGGNSAYSTTALDTHLTMAPPPPPSLTAMAASSTPINQ